MAAVGASSARSNNGCWTCRVRKKKCDEGHPSCSACSSLTLQCFGYGQRPAWMDNGPLQREQALRIKRIVGQKHHRRQKSRILHSSSLRFPGMDIFDKQQLEGPAQSLVTTSAEMSPPMSMTMDQPDSGDLTPLNSWGMDLIDPSINSESISLTPQSCFDQLGWVSGDLMRDGSFNGQDPVLSNTSQCSRYSETVLSPSMKLSAIHIDGKTTEPIFYEGAHPKGTSSLVSGISSAQNPMYDRLAKPAHLVMRWGKAQPITRDSFSQTAAEDDLIMHYLDDVFSAQFPFYNFPDRRSKGWLFSAIRWDKSVYHATIALSQYHLRSTSDTSSRILSRLNHYEIARGELVVIKREAGRRDLQHQLTCLMQLLFYELFAGGTGNWQQHISMAGPLLLSLEQAISSSICTTTSDSVYGDQLPLQFQEQQLKDIDSRDFDELHVTFGSFIWFDLIASASTRSVPSLNLDHRRLLKMLNIDLQSLAGCTKHVMEIIFDIVELDNWKKQADVMRQLSIIELAKKGAKIEENICRTLDELEEEKSEALVAPRGNDRNDLRTAGTEVSRIFALSAQTYLHVVISGAHPGLPEIALSVSRTIDAFMCLSDPHLLRSLVWPFCITGCLATEPQQSAFRDLASLAQITFTTVGTCWQALRIIEECWEMRKTVSSNCDWASVMKKKGCDVLLA